MKVFHIDLLVVQPWAPATQRTVASKLDLAHSNSGVGNQPPYAIRTHWASLPYHWRSVTDYRMIHVILPDSAVSVCHCASAPSQPFLETATRVVKAPLRSISKALRDPCGIPAAAARRSANSHLWYWAFLMYIVRLII